MVYSRNPSQLVLSSVWNEFGAIHSAAAMERLDILSRNPFRWHTVIQGLSHPSTWQGTANAYRMLIGAFLLHDVSPQCDSNCEHCGHDSLFQSIVKSCHVAMNYPSPSSSSSSSPSGAKHKPFLMRFIQFCADLVLCAESPVRSRLDSLVADVAKSTHGTICPLAVFPSIIDIFNGDFRPFFYRRLHQYFHDPSIRRPKKRTLPSVSSFLIMVGAKGYEAATVEGGRTFDAVMTEGVVGFVASLPLGPDDKVDPTTLQDPPLIAQPHVLATSLVKVIKHSLISMFLPPSEWVSASADASLRMQELLTSDPKDVQLKRCRQFMEPSAVLSVIKYMLTRPGAIPDLNGKSNEDKLTYSIANIKIVNFDIDRSVCVLKSVRTASPVTSAVLGFTSVTPEGSARLTLTVKEVNVQVEHDWKLDWNMKRYGSYFGKNIVRVHGLSSQITFTIHPDDRGTVVESATVSLGQVEHSCSILNSNFISELVAQAALDWFAEPLTKLLQAASQTAIEEFLKTANLEFRMTIWNALVLKICPDKVISELLMCLNDHLPRHGVPI